MKLSTSIKSISIKSVAIVFGSIGLLFLGACSSSNQASTSSSSAVSAFPQSAAPSSSDAEYEKERASMSGKGQVVEVGAYHVELVPEKEANSIHLDVFLQKGDTHEPISDAKVKAQVTTPNGTQKSLDLTYDLAGKHYTAKLPDPAAGEYQVAVLSEVKRGKVNARFNFKQ
jgi:hypothetical protein